MIIILLFLVVPCWVDSNSLNLLHLWSLNEPADSKEDESQFVDDLSGGVRGGDTESDAATPEVAMTGLTMQQQH